MFNSRILKSAVLLFIFMFSSVSSLVTELTTTTYLTDDEQMKIIDSIILGDQNENDSVYFAAEPVVDSITAKILYPGEIAIHLVSKNFLPGSRYRLFVTAAIHKCKFIYKLTANKDGALLIENNPNDKLENWHITLFGHMSGEETAFTLISEDGLKYKSTIAVQKPLIAFAKDGAIFKLRLILMDANCFLMQCTGLHPNEKFSFSSGSRDKTLDWSGLANAHGNWQTILQPAVLGDKGGHIELIRENGEILRIFYVGMENAVKITRDEIKRNNSKHKGCD